MKYYNMYYKLHTNVTGTMGRIDRSCKIMTAFLQEFTKLNKSSLFEHSVFLLRTFLVILVTYSHLGDLPSSFTRQSTFWSQLHQPTQNMVWQVAASFLNMFSWNFCPFSDSLFWTDAMPAHMYMYLQISVFIWSKGDSNVLQHKQTCTGINLQRAVTFSCTDKQN